MKKNHGKQTKVLLQLIKTVSLGMNKVVHVVQNNQDCKKEY